MSIFRPDDFPILFHAGLFKRTTGLANNVTSINPNDLFDEYERLRECAPRRCQRNKSYFVCHNGRISSLGAASNSNRGEEHLAIALWNQKRRWLRTGGGWFSLLDYQVPLKAKQSDKRIGKVDLLGVTDRGRLMVIELKVKPRNSSSRGDTPLFALIEGLRYAAIVEANLDVIAEEAKNCFNVDVIDEPPIVQILAPQAWWKGWLELNGSTRCTAGDWEPAFARLLGDITTGRIRVSVECMALDDICDGGITFGVDGRTPTLGHTPALYPVLPGEKRPIGDALP